MEPSRDDFVIAVRSAFLRKGNQQKFSLLSLILFSIMFLVLGNYNIKIIKFNKIVIKEIIYFSSFVVNIPENIIKNSFNKVSDHFDHYDDYLIIKNNNVTLSVTQKSNHLATRVLFLCASQQLNNSPLEFHKIGEHCCCLDQKLSFLRS
jgi:hypothetical protein